MSEKEADRLHVIKLLELKKVNLKKVAELMSLSKRQVIRIKRTHI